MKIKPSMCISLFLNMIIVFWLIIKKQSYPQFMITYKLLINN